MGIVIWLVVGGLVGWLASIVMRTDGQQGLLLNVVVGIVGALLAGFVVSPLLGIGTINEGITVATFLVSLLGAILLLPLSTCSAAARFAEDACANKRGIILMALRPWTAAMGRCDTHGGVSNDNPIGGQWPDSSLQ